ncbi:hydantoinase B/oxoprolinase family protein [Nocardia africana]|uniref:Acetone carboxylase alpha subunit n=1 Tax=Nocardia africana TaxID=134964 RepID=A0A378WZ66_9NOCA|nr:hydantoinase B/oxoprolinase family protein [Nocardia africana]MCC3312967.1 hydantoinase B/oxoprolinase family protein [Nocardia africana]SUA45694.1 Acetone carboxylase alpha subunit [Nocardia africana]
MPAVPVAGSERFAAQPEPLAPDTRAIGEVDLHRVNPDEVAALDPLTYEVVRHRLAAITEEMGDAIKRMSGSVVVTDCNDFGAAILDETGDTVQVGLYNMQLAASVDMAVKWTLHHRSSNPGFGPGDLFLCNDPWVGGGLHQNDVTVLAPLFHDGELFGWTAAVAHQVDLGGVSPGSWSVDGRDVFWESIPTPPVKIVENGRLRADVEDVYLRRSRVPKLVALDLRAKIGANNVAHDRLHALIGKYGARTVKAVMKRMMNDAETRVRAKLAELPDGSWGAVAHQDGGRAGDRAIHKIVLTMTKSGDRLTFDFTGTDPQVDGIINCTLAGLRGGIMPVLLTMLCPDIPWAPGGIYRAVDIVSEPGTLNNCTFPAGIGKASVASAWATQNAVSETVAAMLATHPVHSRQLMSVCCGTWDLTLLAGVDQRGGGFVTMLCDAMAGGLGAKIDGDGVDTGGENCIPMGRVADVEINEFSFPILYLWRREETDSGGPGRYRGGVGASSCFIPHDTGPDGLHLVVSAPGKAVPQAPGLSGGYPAATQHDLLIRDSAVRAAFAAGRIPAGFDDMGGRRDVVPPHLETALGTDDVYYTHWQGGGGIGDPFHREPELVAADVVANKVSPDAARHVYGVVLDDQARPDLDRTAAYRQQARVERAGATTTLTISPGERP